MLLLDNFTRELLVVSLLLFQHFIAPFFKSLKPSLHAAHPPTINPKRGIR